MGSMVIVLVIAGIFAYIGLLFFSGPLLMLAGYLAALSALAAVFLFFRRLSMDCMLEAPIAVADEGGEISLQIEVDNKSPLTCGRIVVCLVIGNTFRRQKSCIQLRISEILPGQNRILYTLRLPEAGCYNIRLKYMRFYDLTGLLWTQKRMNRSVRVQALPDIQLVAVRLTEPVRSFFGDAEIYDQERAGQDTDEVFQIRSFRPGDRLQSIHWKLSAKTDELLVKDYSLPKACPVVLLLDYKKGGQDRDGQKYLRLAAGLSFSLMDAGCSHYVAWYEGRTRGIARVRVDDEASYYLFISSYLLADCPEPDMPIREMYREKYRGENYLHDLRLTEKAELYKDGERLFAAAGDLSGQDVKELEIVV